MRRIIAVLLWAMYGMGLAQAQTTLSLDTCRALALRNNKQIAAARMKQDVAANLRQSARTKYLPHVSALGTYQHTTREVSLLSDVQKNRLSTMGTTAAEGLRADVASITSGLPMERVEQMLGQLGLSLDGLRQLNGQGLEQFADALNQEGSQLIDALRTDTRNMWFGTVMVTQPLFMGGSIVAMNRMADLGEEMAANSLAAREQETLYLTDQAYWTVISLCHKQRLAEQYLALVKKLDGDVQKMIEEGVATRSEGLSVSVKVNEAEMTLTKVADGLVLAKMYLCQLCGLPMTDLPTLADEQRTSLSPDLRETGSSLLPQEGETEENVHTALALRPELRLLENTVDLSRQATNVLRAGNLPQIALTGGYAVSNPNVFNSFEKKFGGFWNVGLLVRIPIWNWGDVAYKVRAAKGATAIAALDLSEAREKVELQVSQVSFRVTEAQKRLQLAQTSIARAEENLRTANLGFAEGVITPATVMEAQTAWLQAQSGRIDAEIDVLLSRVDLQKALGKLAGNEE